MPPDRWAAHRQLLTARAHAHGAQYADMLKACAGLASCEYVDLLLQTANLLQGHGFLNHAQGFAQRASALAPLDLRPHLVLASLAHDAGHHAEARRQYASLQQRWPNEPTAKRNALIGLEYDDAATDAERVALARAWGQWATARAGGPHPRPAARALGGRPLRVGYVSADFGQHTVGLFVQHVLRAHDPARVQATAYSAGQLNDAITEQIRTACAWRDVADISDAAMADMIRADQIDVLVDLSGHTAGSRLTAFAHRPAPVQVSWLGYFATTGLPCIDAVLLDEWHAPPGTEAQLIEPIVRLHQGRLCYQPVPWAPGQLQTPAFERRGHITFGSFNNTSKYNDAVYDVWARVLAAVPGSRLVLKWRTFNDEAVCQRVAQAFAQRGVGPGRLDLRGPSFHVDVLNQYADIDIALDPFPFTGGLTSCEALWMGLPVVTWPLGRVVSRQTWALLNQIGLPELAARSADDYVQVAASLANDTTRLTTLRMGMRQRMLASPLMDVRGFTRSLEDALISLFGRVVDNSPRH